MGLDRVKTTAVIVVDHKTLQVGFIDGDDHRYLEAFSKKYGCWFSPSGNGICHSVFLEDFAVPGKSVIGSDSHTTNAGGMGMLAMGAGGTDVSFSMAGNPYKISMPEVVEVRLSGALSTGVLAKDVILNVLKEMGIKGNKGVCLEYTGEGLKGLGVTDRATIANMGTEAGVTFSIFPSDEITKAYLEDRKRGGDWQALEADDGAAYARTIEINLSELVPTIALYPRLKSMEPVADNTGLTIDAVFIGSCTNANYDNLAKVGEVLRGQDRRPWRASFPPPDIWRSSTPPACGSWRTPAAPASARVSARRPTALCCRQPTATSPDAPAPKAPRCIWLAR